MAEYIRAVSLFTGSLLEVWAIRSSSFKTTIQEHSHETQHCTGNACDLFRRGDLGSSGPSCLSPIFPWRAHLHYLRGAGRWHEQGQGTVPFSINTAGAIAGMYYDANNAYHGFVRAATGTITTFEAPGAGTGAAQGTVSFSINTAGDIAGTYVDARYVYHGFAALPMERSPPSRLLAQALARIRELSPSASTRRGLSRELLDRAMFITASCAAPMER